VQAAYDIARFTAEDPTAGLPDEEDIAKDQPESGLVPSLGDQQRRGRQIGFSAAKTPP
jgi:hypothetical protein